MYRSQLVSTIRAVPVRAHWTFFAVPLAVIAWEYFLHDPPCAGLAAFVFIGIYATFAFQALVQAGAARFWGIGVLDVTFLPLSVIVRLTWISEKPLHELGVHAFGLVARVVTVGLCFMLLRVYGWPVELLADPQELDAALVFNRLAWAAVLVLAVDCAPAFPTSMGYLFRALLALSAKRVRATEITAHLGTVTALLAAAGGIAAYRGDIALPLAGGFLAVYLFVWSQQELADVRYFYSIRRRSNRDKMPAMVLPEDQVVDVDSRPTVPDYNGFTYNARTKLWIEWKNGQPISASALIGQ